MSNNPKVLLDRSDTRVTHAEGLSGAIQGFIDRVRSGDLGSLPVVIGLVIIWTVFYALNPVFLSPNNMVNLFFDCSVVGVISLGIVCVLLLGEIDLSVGSMSGVASALLGVLWVNQGMPVLVAIAAALVAIFAGDAREGIFNADVSSQLVALLLVGWVDALGNHVARLVALNTGIAKGDARIWSEAQLLLEPIESVLHFPMLAAVRHDVDVKAFAVGHLVRLVPRLSMANRRIG